MIAFAIRSRFVFNDDNWSVGVGNIDLESIVSETVLFICIFYCKQNVYATKTKKNLFLRRLNLFVSVFGMKLKNEVGFGRNANLVRQDRCEIYKIQKRMVTTPSSSIYSL